jgi:hypothetical protein
MDGDSAKEEPEVLTWSVRLWEQAPERRWIVLASAIGAGALGFAFFQSVPMALVGFVVIMGSMSECWLPLHFKLDERGASVRCGFSVTAITWDSVKRVAEGEAGLRLSPLTKANRLAPFRGVFLRYAGNRDGVLEYVRNRGGDGARLLEQGTD